MLLNCLLQGEDPTKNFTVEVSKSDNVNHLKRLVREGRPSRLAHVDDSDVVLWKLNTPMSLSLHSSDEISDVAKALSAIRIPDPLSNDALAGNGDVQVLIGVEEVSAYWENAVSKKLHILVQHPSGNLLGDLNAPLNRSQTSPPHEIDNLIADFLSDCRPRMRQFVMSANDAASLLPSWKPHQSSDDTLKHRMSELRIPAVRERPSLLLHNLGEEKTDLDKNRISRIRDIFLDEQNTILINTAGSGKTRLLLDGLCHRWGFYFTADERDIGSEDFRRIVCDLATYRDYQHAKKMNNSGATTQKSIDHTRETACRALSQVLLSRFLILGLLVDEVRALEEQERLPWMQYCRLWILLQVQPKKIFGQDLFLELALRLRPASHSDLNTRTRKKFKELPPQLKEESIYCVLDEAQVTTDVLYQDFFSENGSFRRPLLKEIWRSWTAIFNSSEMSLILSGTGLKEDEIMSTLSSNVFKPANYVLKRDIGAFDDQDDQANYIRMYIPADWTDMKWQQFLKRSWAWFRGRYRNTATLVSLILEVGYQSPHRTIDSYVEKFTAFRPTDADDWTEQETEPPELPTLSTLNFDRMDNMQATTLAKALFDQVIYGTYSLQSFAMQERATFVEYGFARTVAVTNSRATQTILDEPIAILAALNWVNKTASLSHSEYLRHNLGMHSNKGNGFENYLAFYVRRFFEVPQKLAELFTFQDDFDSISWKSEEFELVTVSRVLAHDQPDISVVTPGSGPSSNIGCRAAKGEDVLSWITTNESQFTFCLPSKHFGPDLLFFLRSKVSGKLLLVMVQCKNYSQVALDDLIAGVRTVTPDWFWKSKDTKYKTATESSFPKGGPQNASNLALQTMKALRDIPFGLTTANTQFPILRVFASWPGDPKLDRSNPSPPNNISATNPAGNEDLPNKKKDVDLHPLASLHLENFNRISKEMDITWFRGHVEQNEVIKKLKRSVSEDLDPRKRAKQQGDEMVL